MLVHEHIRNFNARGLDRICIKIDIKKAYDIVNRQFVIHMLNGMSFPTKWVRLIEEIICTPNFSVKEF